MRVDENGWTWVSVEWVLKMTTHSTDIGSPEAYDSLTHFWGMMIESKALDAGFLRVVESLQEHGWMSAINVQWWPEDGELNIIDGHHRLVAAILLCMDEIPMWDWEMGDGRKAVEGCPIIYTHHDHTDEDSLLVEVL